MYESVRRLYQRTGNVALVTAAVNKGWLTPEQGAQIMAEGAEA